jgi:hypothetical protein
MILYCRRTRGRVLFVAERMIGLNFGSCQTCARVGPNFRERKKTHLLSQSKTIPDGTMALGTTALKVAFTTFAVAAVLTVSNNSKIVS